MKKNFTVICTLIAAVALFAFTLNTEPPYENLLDENCKDEFFSNTSSNQLKINLADVYSHEFDFIEKVDLHQNETDRFYYVAYGKKDGNAIVRMINASDEMASQQSYPSRKDLGFSADEAVINCHCVLFLCLPVNVENGKYCGIARDSTSKCKPKILCSKEIEIEGGN